MKQKQSQKNIQIVKVQVGDVKKKRKARKKTVKRRAPPFGGTGLAPILGLTEYPANRAGTQIDPPNINRMVDLEWFKAQKEFLENQGTEQMKESLEQLKKLQEYMKRKGEAPSPWNQPTSVAVSIDPFYQNYRFSDAPPIPLEIPKQPLVSAEAASSSLYPPLTSGAARIINDPTGKYGYRPPKQPLVSAEAASSSALLGINDPTGKYGYRPRK